MPGIDVGGVQLQDKSPPPLLLSSSFDALAETGTVFEKVFNAPWGGLFGVVIDDFGVSWMINSV
ncbi:MAG: hypothetical protein ACT4TC_12840 [Myxococcaceae bacterium]